MSVPIRIHPNNPKLFEFRGKPLVLLTATEHYGAVMNRPFDYRRYLLDAADKKMTLTRLFVLFRELQSACNPYSTCKPESPDYIAPFARTGGGRALDGQPRYNLDEWNPEFFERLHGFLALASDLGIIVEVTLLSNTYNDAVWPLNPLHSANNVNGIEELPWPDYNTLRNPKLFAAQAKHVRKIVEETKRYDNIVYEICNEPGGWVNPDDPNLPSCADVDEWQMAIASVIREAEADMPHPHLISGQEAFSYSPAFTQPSMKSFNDFGIEIVNMHPLPNTTYGESVYHMGEFMMKQLKVRALRDYCLETYHEPKPLSFDEDNAASQYKDVEGWTVHRKRAWTTLMSGGHYDYIDFSIISYMPTGTPESRANIRSWFKHLSEFIHSFDLVRAKPMPGLVTSQPAHTCESVFGVENEDYCVYLADERELDEPGCGSPISGDVRVNLPDGAYQVACYVPRAGLYSPWVTLNAAGGLNVQLPVFAHDIAIRIRRI